MAVLVGLHYFGSAWTAILCYNIGMAAFLFRQRFNWKTLWRGWHARDGLWLCVLAGSAGLWLILFKSVWLINEAGLDQLLHQVGLSGHRWTLFFIYYIVATPILEEAFWRGALGSSSAQPRLFDLLFAGYHILVLIEFTSLPIAILSGGGLVIIAWLWRCQCENHSGLAVPLISHFVADASIMLAVQFLR